jgi:ketosteroid isomerase-like protein
MDTEATRKLVLRFLEARAANDSAALSELLTDDAEWRPPPGASIGPFRGRENVVKALAGGVAGQLFDLSTMRRDVRKVVVDGDTAGVQQRLTATTKSGAEYSNEYAWFYTCRDGKISLLEEYADTLRAARILGQIKD